MAVRVYGNLFDLNGCKFEAYDWQVDEGYLDLKTKSGDTLVTFAPGWWSFVQDLDPAVEA